MLHVTIDLQEVDGCHGHTVNIFRYSDRQKDRGVWEGYNWGWWGWAVDIDSVHKLKTEGSRLWNKTSFVSLKMSNKKKSNK